MTQDQQDTKKAGPGLDFGEVERFHAREDEGTVFQPKGPDGKPLFDHEGEPVQICVAGTYSNIYARAEEEFSRLQWQAEEEGKPAPEDWIRARDEHVNSKCILWWSGFYENREPVELTTASALKALRIKWLRPQILKRMDDHSGFFGPSSGD